MHDLYIRLAKHLESLIMGYPYTEELIDLLKEMFSPTEARVALAIPNNLAPPPSRGSVQRLPKGVSARHGASKTLG